MIKGTILRQFKFINIDPYANGFNRTPDLKGENMADTGMKPELHERKYEIDSLCYPIRLAYAYWKTTGDASIFGEEWQKAIKNVLIVFREQQKKNGRGSYSFLRITDRAYDTLSNAGWGTPVTVSYTHLTLPTM